jgi:PAS domain S-box-containing protein
VTIDSDSNRFSRALRSAILWPVGVILLTALLLLLLAIQLFQVVKWSEHSYDVLEETSQCKNQALAIQNQVRGYLLTGDSTFVASLDQEHKEMDAAFFDLKKLVNDNPAQVARAEDLIQTKNAWFEHTQQSVTQRSQGINANADWTTTGKILMDDVVKKFDKFTGVEEGLRQQRQKRVRRMKQSLVYVGSGLVVLLSLTVGQLVRRTFTTLAGDYRSALEISHQRQADLEEQKEWFRVTLGSIGDGVIVTDIAGRVVFMNRESERLTGWKSTDAHLQPLQVIFKIINEDTRNPVEDPVNRVFREKKVVGLANHTVLISSQGQEWPIEDSAAPILDGGGKLLGVVLVFHNAMEMRQAQNTLKAYSEDLEKKVTERTLSLQQTVAELETFSYTISHDLRSPLRAMQGFAQAVVEDYADKLDETGKNYLDRIGNAAERLDRLIQDLLAFTRISREEAPLVEIDLDKSVRDIIEHYPNLRPPAVQIEVIGTLPKVLGREAAVTQVISNLLGNAVKFVAPGTVPSIEVWSEDLGPQVRLFIQDNGIGIAARDFERIFQMFTQVNAPTVYGGTGIGLAIVKKAVQALHGSVGLESEAGTGSKFWVELSKSSP